MREAFGHLKAIGATVEGVELVKLACAVEGMHFSTQGNGEVVSSYGVVTAGTTKPESFKEGLKMVKGAKDFMDAYAWQISQHRCFERELEGLSEMVAY